ncbi:hypothetical protein M9Y10_009776 [Tritrichomonas musculus]|uniref:Uncharacterized protein n=1 Tax=Tritrichomonas musculus TaxID=1915356 RepID=A0ABR2IQ88_9EUKA
MFFFVFGILSLSINYPLIIGVPSDSKLKNIASFDVKENLPSNLCIFIIDQVEQPQITTIRQLMQWGNSARVCQNVGNYLQFSSLDSSKIDFVSKMRHDYEAVMDIDSKNECVCKLRYYHGGLVVIRVGDNEDIAITEALEKLPEKTSLAFVAANGELFGPKSHEL